MSDDLATAPLDSSFELARFIAFLLAMIENAASGAPVSSNDAALLASLSPEQIDLLTHIAERLKPQPVQP